MFEKKFDSSRLEKAVQENIEDNIEEIEDASEKVDVVPKKDVPHGPTEAQPNPNYFTEPQAN